MPRRGNLLLFGTISINPSGILVARLPRRLLRRYTPRKRPDKDNHATKRFSGRCDSSQQVTGATDHPGDRLPGSMPCRLHPW